MSAHFTIKAAILVAFFAAAPFMAGADEPAAAPAPPTDNSMMGHSPADAKSMRGMKPAAPAGEAAEAPAAPSNGMGHSPASKEMTMMDRTKGTGATTPSDSGEHVMMDHSAADAKSMRHMKNKHPKIHKSKDAEPAK